MIEVSKPPVLSNQKIRLFLCDRKKSQVFSFFPNRNLWLARDADYSTNSFHLDSKFFSLRCNLFGSGSLRLCHLSKELFTNLPTDFNISYIYAL